MSGGHFDHAQYRITDIAEEIEELVARNDDVTLDEWGQRRGRGYPPEIIDKFREAVTALKAAHIMARRIDYLVSGDDGPESFMRRWDEELKKLRTQGGTQ